MKKNIGLAILLAIFVKTNDVSASSGGRVVEISGRNNQVITGEEIKKLNLTDSDSLVISGNNNLNHDDKSKGFIVFDTNIKSIDTGSFIVSNNQQKIEITEESKSEVHFGFINFLGRYGSVNIIDV